jgi:hypothetical protein
LNTSISNIEIEKGLAQRSACGFALTAQAKKTDYRLPLPGSDRSCGHKQTSVVFV